MSEEPTVDAGDLDHLLDYVERTRAFDFVGYKRRTLIRRIGRRMAEIGIETYADYERHLEIHPDEFVAFFNAVLVNVTSFFRDRSAWRFVADEVVPRIISGKESSAPVRVWSAGCASGEEAYTLAMILGEALGDEAFRARVKVYATDVDEGALAHARSATYSAKNVEAVPEDLRARYFEATARGYTFRADLRRSLIFGRHDLLHDAPISRLDLLVCRNTLVYFDAESQATIVDRFRFALAGGGYLFLGRAETLLTHSSAFRPLQLRMRVFESIRAENEHRISLTPRVPASASAPESPRAKLLDAAFEMAEHAMIVVDSDGLVQSVNAAARLLFGIAPGQLGLPLHDFEVSYHPVELRSVIEEAYNGHQGVARRGVEWRHGDDARVFDVLITPLREEASGMTSGVSITFDDITRLHQLDVELEHSAQELQIAHDDLRSTNEEVQLTNEALHATNEALQATNTALETMNEVLRSTNDELKVVIEMLDARGELRCGRRRRRPRRPDLEPMVRRPLGPAAGRGGGQAAHESRLRTPGVQDRRHGANHDGVPQSFSACLVLGAQPARSRLHVSRDLLTDVGSRAPARRDPHHGGARTRRPTDGHVPMTPCAVEVSQRPPNRLPSF